MDEVIHTEGSEYIAPIPTEDANPILPVEDLPNEY